MSPFDTCPLRERQAERVHAGGETFEQEWQGVVRGCAGMVRRVLASRVLRWTSDDVDDILSDLKLEVYRNRERFMPVNSFLTWTIGCARFAALRFRDPNKSLAQRYQNVELSLEDIPTDKFGVSFEPDPLHEVEMRDAVSRLKNILTERQYRVLVLHYVEGMTFREIGEGLSITHQGVKSAEMLAVAKAQKYMDNPLLG